MRSKRAVKLPFRKNNNKCDSTECFSVKQAGLKGQLVLDNLFLILGELGHKDKIVIIKVFFIKDRLTK